MDSMEKLPAMLNTPSVLNYLSSASLKINKPAKSNLKRLV
jgi:hypothetical protein